MQRVAERRNAAGRSQADRRPKWPLIGRWIDAARPTARDEPEKLDPGLEITPEERAFWSFQPIPAPVPIPGFTRPIGCARRSTPFWSQALRAKSLSFSPDATQGRAADAGVLSI